jgi:cobalt-zinc-cadmium efflux system membrane fusion protein
MRRELAVLAALPILFSAGCSRESDLRTQTSGKQADRGGLPRPALGTVRLDPDSPQLQRIQTAVVETALVPLEEVVAPGRIQAIPTRISRIAVPVPGRIQRVTVTLGDTVQEGQVLFTLSSPEVSALISAYRQAEARLRQAQVALAKAEADLARVRDLYEHRAIAQKEVISAETALAQARADAEQASAGLQENLSRLEILGVKPDSFQQEIAIRSPVTGKILDINLAAGEYRTDTAAPVITIADLSLVYVAADVPESQIRLITPGERVEVKLAAFPGQTFSARVSRISAAVNPDTRTIQVMAELANPEGRFLPDMFGEIRHEETFQTVPVVPAGAIVQREGKTSVWREIRSGEFQTVDVTTGRPRGGLVPVLSGIRPGDRVVVDGTMLLERGS